MKTSTPKPPGATTKAAGVRPTEAAVGSAEPAALNARDFDEFRRFIYERAGIHMNDAKKALVAGRLVRRLRALGLATYTDYVRLLRSGRDEAECQSAIDLLTTNETYFFREIRHFDFLRERILPHHSRSRPFRVWSAASSSGEEAYSIAMLLQDQLGDAQWEILGTDISSKVLARARGGHYNLERTEAIPKGYLEKFCLKGVGAQAGTFLVDEPLRRRVRFEALNLNGSIPTAYGEFDVIFLRNVMIYFNLETKRRLVDSLYPHLRRGGHLFIGHSESLNGITSRLTPVQASIYVRR